MGANAQIYSLKYGGMCGNPVIVGSSIYNELDFDINYCFEVKAFDESLKVNKFGVISREEKNYNASFDCNALDELLDDKNLSLLWSRFSYRTQLFNFSSVHRNRVESELVNLAFDFFKENKIGKIIFAYEPHILPIYILKKVARYLNVECYTMTISPFPWLMMCRDDSGKIVKLNSNDKLAYKSVNCFISEKLDSYEVAKPYYERNTEKLPSGVDAFRWLLKKGTRKLGRSLLQLRLLKSYKGYVAQEKKIPEKYIAFLLHYQPEQTTLPDGGVFADQMIAIRMLASACNELGLSIVVREHPATFYADFYPEWRSSQQYQSLVLNNDNIYLGDLDQSPYDLIDSAEGVATITGTAILEALLRGKPAISFGKTTPVDGFKNEALISEFSTVSQLSNKLSVALRLDRSTISSSMQDYLFNLVPYCFGADNYTSSSEYCNKSLKQSRTDAFLQVYNSVINNDC